MTAATGYDGLSSCTVAEPVLREFLLSCFDIGEHELFIGHEDRVDEDLRDTPADTVFAAFCTYREVSGDFAMCFSVGIEGRLVDRVGRHEFARRFAARFDANVLYGCDEPPGLWTVVLPGGQAVLAAMEEGEDRYRLSATAAPIPGLPGLPSL
ncbi:hypothetical protein [Allokutzneria albata]|uniref:Uncharacterized protein n=1 Tax=Allokutzneria albata TaxID=211114 RepID=A0A1G9UU19_ALLAB|nr:hypothetical protein [Allokutzneria albata]SDM63390.1 hypothetical protein SAMN04489726_2625 [Allokutzneria albata]